MTKDDKMAKQTSHKALYVLSPFKEYNNLENQNETFYCDLGTTKFAGHRLCRKAVNLTFDAGGFFTHTNYFTSFSFLLLNKPPTNSNLV